MNTALATITNSETVANERTDSNIQTIKQNQMTNKQLPEQTEIEINNKLESPINSDFNRMTNLNKLPGLKWHIKLGHASVKYLRKMKKYAIELRNVNF